MYLTPYQKKQIKYVVALILGIPATLLVVYQGVQLISQASADATPKDVIVSNVTTSSIVVSWVTEKSVEGYVIPVVSGQEQSPIGDKRGNKKYNTHYIEIKSLEPDTLYSFTLMSDGQKYTKGSIGEYKFKTAAVNEDTPVPNPIHGTVTGGSPEEIIVYVGLKSRNAYPVSTIVPSSGNWIVDLSALRSISDMSLIQVTDQTEIILIARESSTKGYELEGSYSALFDNNSKLNQTYTFKMEDLENFLSYFPTESILGNAIEPEPEPEPEEPTPTPPQTYTPPSQPIVKTYTIKNDLSWVDLVESDLGLESGESTVQITNISDKSFAVVWRSEEKEEGYIKFGTSKAKLDTEANDMRDTVTERGEYNSHFIETPILTPETTYYFEIYSGEEVYDNGGVKFTVTTPPTPVSAPAFETRTGTLLNSTDPSDVVIVFKLVDNDESGTAGSSSYLSVLPEDDGTWIVEIGNARSSDGETVFSASTSDILQAHILGALDSKLDFNLSEEDIEIDMDELNTLDSQSSVQLLSDYGIINVK